MPSWLSKSGKFDVCLLRKGCGAACGVSAELPTLMKTALRIGATALLVTIS